MDIWTESVLFKMRNQQNYQKQNELINDFYNIQNQPPKISKITFYEMLDLIDLRGVYGIPIIESIYLTPLFIMYQPKHLGGLWGEKIIVSSDIYKFIKTITSLKREDWEKSYSRWWPSLYCLERPIISIA